MRSVARVGPPRRESTPPPTGGEPNASPGGELLPRTFALAPPSIGLLLGGANLFVSRDTPTDAPSPTGGAERTGHDGLTTSRPPAPTRAEAKERVQGALTQAARERERELGLGPEGPVLTALEAATYAGNAPIAGKATFLAIADDTGEVRSIEVVGMDADPASWRETARAALRALRGKRLRMPSAAKRAEMRIEIASELKLPSGHDPGTSVKAFGVPVQKGDGKRSSAISVLDPIPKVRAEIVEVAPGVKVPIVSVDVELLRVDGDPANIGAKARRVVRATLINSTVL